MNERIKELAFRAMSINQKVSDDSFFVEVSKLNEFERFAELIVRECMSLCTDVEEDVELSDYVGSFRDGAMMCREDIKQHFGVEE